MTISYRIYSLTMTWLAFSYYTGPYYPYMGLPRHLLLAFPVFIGLAQGATQALPLACYWQAPVFWDIFSYCYCM